jgi:hypothetical protein
MDRFIARENIKHFRARLEAEAAAVEQFHLNDEQRKRLMVQELAD